MASITTIATNLTLICGIGFYLVDATINNITITLPVIIDGFTFFTLKRIDNNSNNTVTIIGQVGETIDNNPNKLLNPNTTTMFAKYDIWYSFNMNPVGSEINLSFNQLVGTNSTRPYVVVRNPVFTAIGIINYNGKKYYGVSPNTLEISYGIDNNSISTATFTIQLQDLINKTIIATIGPITQSGSDISYYKASTSQLSNIPYSETRFEVDAKITGNTSVRLYSVKLILN